MKNKIFTIFVTLLMILSTIVIFSDNNEVVASSGSGGGSEEGGIGIDFQYIWNITDNLSNVIIDAYEPGDLRKGRYFGSKGEEYTADDILQDKMNELGLYNPGLSPPYLEQIENITSLYYYRNPTLNLTDDVDILSLGITIYNKTSQSNDTITDFHIRPIWNRRAFGALIEILINKSATKDWLKNKLKIENEYWYNMIWNNSWLTKNVSYENLNLRLRPDDRYWFIEVLEAEWDNISSNESIVDLASFLHYFLPKFQSEQGFYFGTLNENNASNLDWFNEQWYDETKCGEDFLFICFQFLFINRFTIDLLFYCIYR